MVNKNSLETGRICVMEGSRQVLVKVMLFQLQEHFHPHDGATPSFFNESRSSLLVLSIDVSFVSKFLWKGDKNFENQTSGPIYMEDPVSFFGTIESDPKTLQKCFAMYVSQKW